MNIIGEKLNFKTSSTTYRALNYYKNQLESIRDEAKNKFHDFVLSDIKKEIENIDDVLDDLNESDGSEMSNDSLEIMNYALQRYSYGLKKMREKIKETFPKSPLKLTQIDKEIEKIEQTIEELPID